MHAETAYIFRHALLRDAAYGLQPPGERGALHGLALEIMETLFGAHELETFAPELAEHARTAQEYAPEGGERERLLDVESRYLQMAVEFFKRTWQIADELGVRERLADHPRLKPAAQRGHLREALERSLHQGDIQRALRLGEEVLKRSRAAADTEDETLALLGLAEARRQAGLDWTSEVPMQALVERTQGMPVEARLTALRMREIELNKLGDRPGARRLLEQALSMARKAQLYAWEAEFTAGLAHECLADGEADRAIELGRRNLDLAEKSGDKQALARAMNHLGIIHIETGDLPGALRMYTGARQLAHEVGAQGLEMTVAVNAGNLQLYFTGDLASAEQDYLVALNNAYERGSPDNAIATLLRLSGLCSVKDDDERAHRYLQEVVRLAEHTNSTGAKAAARVQMTRCRAPLAPWQRLESAIQGIELARGISAGRTEVEAWAWIAMLLCDEGAFEACKRAVKCCRELGENVPGGYAFGLHANATQGMASLLAGQLDEARECATEFLDKIGPNSAHHRVAKGDVVVLAALAQQAAGEVGTRRIEPATRARLVEMRDRMHQAMQGTDFRFYGRPRAALELADRLVMIAESEPPYPLFFGVTPEFLTGPQLDAMVRRLEADQSGLLRELRSENPRLWDDICDRRFPGWPAWNARLEDLPGMQQLMSGIE